MAGEFRAPSARAATVVTRRYRSDVSRAHECPTACQIDGVITRASNRRGALRGGRRTGQRARPRARPDTESPADALAHTRGIYERTHAETGGTCVTVVLLHLYRSVYHFFSCSTSHRCIVNFREKKNSNDLVMSSIFVGHVTTLPFYNDKSINDQLLRTDVSHLDRLSCPLSVI